jgi:hypothetical protein
MKDYLSAYFIYKTFTNPVFWVICGVVFAYNFIGEQYQKFVGPPPATDPDICIQGACPNPKKSIAILTKQIAKNPKDSELYTHRGDTYCIMKQVNPCIADYDIGIKLSQNKAEDYLRLAIMLTPLDRVRSAEAFDRSIKLYHQRGDTKNAEMTRDAKFASGL